MRTDGSIPLIPFGLFRAPDIFLYGQTVQRFVIFYMRFNCDHKFLIPSINGAKTFFRNQRSLPVTLLKHRNHAFLILYAFYFIYFFEFWKDPACSITILLTIVICLASSVDLIRLAEKQAGLSLHSLRRYACYRFYYFRLDISWENC